MPRLLHHRVGHCAGRLVEHEPFDGTELLAAATADRRALNPITGTSMYVPWRPPVFTTKRPVDKKFRHIPSGAKIPP